MREAFRYEKLEVWQRSMDLWMTLHRLTLTFPRDELYGLTSQIRRAASSVPANLAEGTGKGSDPAFALHIRHARGSIYEVATFLEGARRLGYLDPASATEVISEVIEIRRMIETLLKSIERRVVKEELVVYDAGSHSPDCRL